MDLSIFKAYDVRGIYPAEFDEKAAYAIVQAYVKFLKPKTVVLGRDVRASGQKLWEAAKQGLVDHGVEVIDIGVISTDMMYFAVANYKYAGGITISASHNPAEYNGMKLVKAGAEPISWDTGIQDIMQLVKEGYAHKAGTPGKVIEKNIQADYLAKCLSLIDVKKIKAFKVAANGMFGQVAQNVTSLDLPIKYSFINDKPDGTFPKGPPDPMLEENKVETGELVKKSGSDFGVAWDGDADRCFLFDETGRAIPAYYLTALLGEYFAKKNPGAKIICDARLTWAVKEKVEAAGGKVLYNKAGHSFIKERMRIEDAVFAGEASGHMYFKDYFYCDNGLIPYLLFLQILSDMPKGQKVSEIFQPYFDHHPVSGELNTRLPSNTKPIKIMERMLYNYHEGKLENIDGLSIEFPEWRANIRSSNTEPLVRLNVEAINEKVLQKMTQELLMIIRS